MATIASPLPQPQQVQPSAADLMLLAAANAVNGQHPDIAAGAAQTAQDPATAALNAQGMAQLSVTQGQVENLQQQSAKQQQQLWDGFTAQQQQQFQSAGYKPPAPHRSLWGDITHVVGHAASDTLNAAGSPLRAVQHGIRSAIDLADEAQMAHGDTSGAGLTKGNGNLGRDLAEWGTAFGKLSNVDDWARAWKETTHGESFILPSAKTNAQQQFGPKVYALAYALATGKKPQDLLQAVPQAQQQALYQQIASPEVQKAVAYLNAGKATPGRVLVGPDYIERHPGAGSAMSGAIDGMVDWFGDPINIAGMGAGEAAKARYLVSKPEDVQMLYNRFPTVKAAMADIAQHVADGNVDGLLTRYPKLKLAAQQLMAAQADTQEKVLQYFKDTAEGADTIAGIPGNALGEFSPSLPHLTRRGEARLMIKENAIGKIDWMADHLPSIKTARDDTVASATTKDKILYTPGQMFQKALTLVPQNRVLRLTGPDALNVLRDIGLQFLPRDVVNKYLVEFARDPDINHRMLVYRSLMLHMGKQAGLDQDPQFWENWTGKFVAQNHLFGEKDALPIDGQTEHYGFLKRHLAQGVAIPDFREMYLQGRKGAVTQALTNGLNARGIDRFMGLWRPLTLAHLGFATRVGGEEAFGFMLRHGLVAYLKASAGKNLAKNMLRDRAESALADTTGDSIVESEASGMWDRLAGHLPAHVQDGIATMQDLLKERAIDGVKRAFHNVETKLTGEQYRDAVEAMVAHGVFDEGGPYEKFITAMHYDTHDAGDLDGQNWAKAKVNGKFVPAQLVGAHEYQYYLPNDQLYMHMWYHRLHQFASDDWGRAALKMPGGNLAAGAKYNMRINNVAKILQDDPIWEQESMRSMVGRMGTQGVSKEKLAKDHAQVIVDNADHLLNKWVKDAPGLTKVVDKTGQPLRVYHGTNQAFTDFADDPEGIYFSSSPQAASFHASKWRGEAPGADRGSPQVRMAYLDMRNPAHLEHLSEEDAQDVLANDIPKIKAQGHDGIFYTEDGAPAFVAFKPSQIKDTPDALTQGGHYEEIPGLRDHLLANGKPPTLAALEDLGNRIPGDLPRVVGQKYDQVIVNGGKIQHFTNSMFKNWIGPQIDWISRQPMFVHEYAKARIGYEKMAGSWAKQGMRDDDIEKLRHDSAMDLAMKNVLPYVHNPQLRSEMSVITRNLAPFWFAQEQFYKRWARTAAYNPAAFRKAQLLAHGLRHSGFIHVNPEDGQEYFVYPGSGLVQDVISTALNPFFKSSLPIAANLIGQVNMLNPAIQRLGGPSFGPVMTVPLNLLQGIDPHFHGALRQRATQFIEGSQAAAAGPGVQGFIQDVTPATIHHALGVMAPTAFNSAQYASAQMQAIQALEATGHGIGTPAIQQVESKAIANPQAGDYVLDGAQAWVYQPDGKWILNNSNTLNDYKTRVQNWARIFLLTRALFGFAAPAAPETQFNPGNMQDQLQTLMKQMPIDEALTTFLAEHPNASAMTVFQTQTPGGGFLPATKAAMQFLDAHPNLEKEYPLAAAYLIPQQDTKGAFSSTAYQEQLAQGLRQRKSPEQFYQEVIYNAAAQDYYRAENYKNTLIASHSMPSAQISNEWTQWSEQFMAANPIFASLLGTGTTGSTLQGTAGAGELGRQQVMNQIISALQNNAVPQTEQTSALTELVDQWGAWQSLTNTYGNPNQPAVNTGMRIMYDEQFAQWLQGFEQEFPSMQALIRRAIAPDLTQAVNDLSAQNIVVNL